MNAIGRHGRALLDDARRERTPDAAARERVFAALMEDTAVTTLAKAVKPRPETKPLTPFAKCLTLFMLFQEIFYTSGCAQEGIICRTTG